MFFFMYQQINNIRYDMHAYTTAFLRDFGLMLKYIFHF